MNANALTLLAVLAGSTALAQDYHRAAPVNAPMPAVVQPYGQHYGQYTYAPPARADGRWELRTSQQWVPGAMTQVYVAGSCYGHGFRRVCQPGRYVTQQLPGHYESRQEWVFIAYGYRSNEYGRGHERHDRHERHGRRGF